MEKNAPVSNEAHPRTSTDLQRARETKANLIMASESRAMFMVRARIKGSTSAQYLFFKTEEEFDEWGLGPKGENYDGHIVYDVQRAMTDLKAAVGETYDTVHAAPSAGPQKTSEMINRVRGSIPEPGQTASSRAVDATMPVIGALRRGAAPPLDQGQTRSQDQSATLGR
jgi:hypothetical protein